jgi:hypothetical protein
MTASEPQDDVPVLQESFRAIGTGSAGYRFHFDLAAGILGCVEDALEETEVHWSKLAVMTELAAAHTQLALAALQDPSGHQTSHTSSGRWVYLPPDLVALLVHRITDEADDYLNDPTGIRLVALSVADLLRSFQPPPEVP